MLFKLFISGSNYFNNVLKRTLTNQPDLTIHEEFHTLDSRRTRNMSTSTHTRQEHLYEVPQLANRFVLIYNTSNAGRDSLHDDINKKSRKC